MLQRFMLQLQEKIIFPISLYSIFFIGLAQIFIWGGSFFLLAVFSRPIMQEMGWGREIIYGGLSTGLLVSALVLTYLGHLFRYFQAKNILAFSGFAIAIGLVTLAYSSTLWSFYSAWIIIGVGMALGLYDTLFATFGHYFGLNAKKLIVALTLISGFCTTIVWPLQVYLISLIGWRDALLVWAVLLFIFIAPIYYFCLPTTPISTLQNTKKPIKNKLSLNPKVYYLMSTIFMFSSIIMTIVSIQLIDILQEIGMTLVAAIAVCALLGPSQIVSRIFDIMMKVNHPIHSLLVSVCLVSLGLLLLTINSKYAAIGIMIYGAGNGLRSIIRGTLPLVLVPKDQYPLLMGKLAAPSVLAQAFTPFIAGYIMDKYHVTWLLTITVILAMLNIIFSALLMRKIKYS